MKKVLCLVLIIGMLLGAMPALAKSDGGRLSDTISWSYNDGVLKVSGTGEIPDVPDGGYPAWERYRQDIKKVVVEEGITSIGRNVFQYWIKGVSMYGYGSTLDADVAFIKNAEFEVTLPDSLKEIKYGAFFQRHGLKSVTLPKGIEKIESNAFSSTGLTDVYYKGTAEEWANVIVEDSKILSGNITIHFEEPDYDNFIMEETEDTVIIKGYKDPTTIEVYVPGEINGKKVVIGEGAFEWKITPDNRALEKVTIAEGITSLPKECFYFSSVKEVILPESLNEIGERAFSNCSNLNVIDIKNVTTICSGAFDGCENLVTLTHSGKLEAIGEDAFNLCLDLKTIDLSTVKTLGVRAFFNCDRLTKVNLQSLEEWSGVKDSMADENGRCYTKQIPHTHGGQSYYIGLNAHVYAPFMNCRGIEDVTVRYPDNKAGEPFPALFLNCQNIRSFTIENYQDSLSRWEASILAFDNTDGYIFLGDMPWGMTIYSSNEDAEEYAKKLGVDFVLTKDNRIEVEPKIQDIHGGVIMRQFFVERITKIAESLGGTVTVSGDSIAVQKDGKSMAIANDTVYYMDNGTMVTESIYYNESFLKIPEKALESVLGTDSRKSEEYKKAINGYSSEIYHILGTIETPYGSIVAIYAGYDVLHGFTNVLNFVKWDGEVIDITEAAPYKNPWSPAEWEKLELSHDSKVLTITYPENKKKTEYYYGYQTDKKVLWDEGTYIITANLETGDVKCVIKPIKDEKVEEKDEVSTVERVEPVKTIEKDDMKVGVSILSEPQNGPANMFDDDYVSYCVLYVKDETNPEYMEFDLGKVKNVEQLALAFRDATTRTTYFDVRISSDGVNFETVIPKRGSNADTNGLQYFDINRDARYVRVYGYSNTYNRYWVSITEAKVYVNKSCGLKKSDGQTVGLFCKNGN